MSDDNEQYYVDNAARLNTIFGGDRAKHWRMIRECRDTEFYLTDTTKTAWMLFFAHMKNKWGIQLANDPEGNIVADIIIVDEQKYLLFLLKYA